MTSAGTLEVAACTDCEPMTMNSVRPASRAVSRRSSLSWSPFKDGSRVAQEKGWKPGVDAQRGGGSRGTRRAGLARETRGPPPTREAPGPLVPRPARSTSGFAFLPPRQAQDRCGPAPRFRGAPRRSLARSGRPNSHPHDVPRRLAASMLGRDGGLDVRHHQVHRRGPRPIDGEAGESEQGDGIAGEPLRDAGHEPICLVVAGRNGRNLEPLWRDQPSSGNHWHT
jgi:hypothetical protein